MKQRQRHRKSRQLLCNWTLSKLLCYGVSTLFAFSSGAATPVVAAQSGTVAAVPGVDVSDFQHEQQSVRELMRLESALALRAARERLNAAQADENKPGLMSGGRRIEISSSADEPELRAIYGVGTRMLAEVRHAGRLWVYLAGRPFPVGATSGTSLYLLQDIRDGCVSLARGNTRRVLCLNGRSGSGS